MDELKNIIGNNLSELRKESGKTQLEIANIFGYTDKAVSKWENGDTLPDIETLHKIAKYYGVTIDYLTNDLPDEKRIEMENKNNPTLAINRILIVSLAISLVWMLATIIFVWLLIFNEINKWEVFIAAIPVSCLVLSFYNKMWGKKKYSFYIATLFIWGLITTIYLFFIDFNLWPLFLIGVPSQIIIFLSTRMKYGFVKTMKISKKNRN